MVTVAQLIEFLKNQPQDAICTYGCYSEQTLLELEYIHPSKHCEPRPDGWVQNERPDMPTQTYLDFPGN